MSRRRRREPAAMWVRWDDAITQIPSSVRPTACMVIQYMQQVADWSSGKVRAKVRTIADRVGRSARHVRRALRALEGLGLVLTKYVYAPSGPRRGQRANTYYLARTQAQRARNVAIAAAARERRRQWREDGAFLGHHVRGPGVTRVSPSLFRPSAAPGDPARACTRDEYVAAARRGLAQAPLTAAQIDGLSAALSQVQAGVPWRNIPEIQRKWLDWCASRRE